jgi:hypothetical protein
VTAVVLEESTDDAKLKVESTVQKGIALMPPAP